MLYNLKAARAAWSIGHVCTLLPMFNRFSFKISGVIVENNNLLNRKKYIFIYYGYVKEYAIGTSLIIGYYL